MPSELPTWWPLEFANSSRAIIGGFATVYDDRPECFAVYDTLPNEPGKFTRVDCETMLAVLIEIARRKAPHTLPPSYLSE